jgi:hypothetical protein
MSVVRPSPWYLGFQLPFEHRHGGSSRQLWLLLRLVPLWLILLRCLPLRRSHIRMLRLLCLR